MKTTLITPPNPARRPGWHWWLGGLAGLLLVGWLVLYFGLDPWLRRQLEKQVAHQTAGRYWLQIGSLHTGLATGTVSLLDVRLRPTTLFRPGPDSLPKLALDLQNLHLSGISLLALWRRRPQHLGLVRLSGLRLELDSLPDTHAHARPLHQRLPARIPGLRLDCLELRAARLLYKGRRRPRLAFQRLDLTGRDLRIDSAAATDTTRLLYAHRWQAHLRAGQGLFDHHRGKVRALAFDSQTGIVAVDSFQMRPTRIGRRGPTYLTMRVGRARLTGWRVSALHRRRFRADSLRITGLHFDLTAPTTPPPPIHQLLAPIFRRLDVADARLTDGYVRVRGVSYVPIIRDLQLHAHHLRIDSAAFADRRRVLYARAWEMRTGPGETLIDGSDYRARYAALAAETRTGLLHVTTVHIAPILPIGELARLRGHEVSHLTVRLPELLVQGLDYGALLRKEGLLAQEITLRQLTLRVVGDGRYPINPRESVVTPEAVGKLPFRVDLRRIDVVGCRLDFAYTAPASNQAGTMRVTRLDGSITNATNDPARMSAATPTVARASAWLQDRCSVRATGRFNLLDPQGRHEIKGTFGPAPFAILNPMLAPSSLMRFKNGQAQGVEVSMTGDRERVTGTMRARYTGMHVTLLNKDLEKTLLTKIKSKAANKLVLHDNNPDKPTEALRIGQIESKRERRFSVFALWKQGLLSGMLNSFGVSEAKAQASSENTTNPEEMPGSPEQKDGAKHPLRPIKQVLKKLLPGKG